jgi:predicted glutamine amidotransferase
MCIIAVVPQGRPITDETLRACWDSNDDGAGFAYVNSSNGRVTVRKGFMKFDEFLSVFRKKFEENNDKSPFVIHFRIRTHGACDAERTHPFYVGTNKDPNRPCVAHNGVLGCVPYDKEKSDTQLFLEKYPKFFESSDKLKEIKEELGKAIGWNKFAVLFPNKEVVIVNDQMGDTNEDGVWFSNRNYLYRTYSRYTTTTTTNRSRH